MTDRTHPGPARGRETKGMTWVMQGNDGRERRVSGEQVFDLCNGFLTGERRFIVP